MEYLKPLAPKIDLGIRPCFNLFMYNALNCGMAPERAVFKILRLLESENRCRRAKRLPTIGIEIECFIKYATPELISVLNELGVSNHSPEGHLQEVNPAYSYSAKIPGAYLSGLIMLGIIPLVAANGSWEVNRRYIHSLHLNFGLPEPLIKCYRFSQLELAQKYWEDLDIFSDALSFAYASLERLENGDYGISVKIHLEEGRLEYRANEFHKAHSYRLLFRAQQLCSLMFAFMVDKEKGEASSRGQLWQSFKKEFRQYRNNYQIARLNLYDSKWTRTIALEKIKEKAIKECARELVEKYSRLVIQKT